jgi:D-3-phosphoglycerate dehydrogenase
MKIAILDDYQDAVRHLDCFRLLDGHEVKIFSHGTQGVGHLAVRLASFEALVLIRERTVLTRAVLQRLPKLRVISQTGKVSGHIDMAAAGEHGIRVLEGSGDPTAPAELTWALIMAAMRRVPRYASNLRQGLWQHVSDQPQFNTIGLALKGRALGLWGYGKIGKLVAGYGRAFGMKVLIWGSENSRAQAAADGHMVAASREEFFASADVLSLHLRLTPQTRGMIVAEDLARMKPTALFVNTSRAELVEPEALESALLAGRPGQAALDVFETEPLPRSSSLLRMDNVLATPHLGYVEKDGYELYFGAAFRNLLNFIAGEPDQSNSQ